MPDARQKELFGNHAAAPDDFRQFARVVFNRPIRSTFIYGVPAVCENAVAPGKRVLAPFGKGNRRTLGYCVDLSTERPVVQELKTLISVTDESPLLSASM